MNNDLISRSALVGEYEDYLLICESGGLNTAHEMLEAAREAPAIDAVEVVRCKDCKHRGIANECPMCYTEDSYDEDYGYDYWDVDKTVDDGFCHCGEVDAEVE